MLLSARRLIRQRLQNHRIDYSVDGGRGSDAYGES